MRKTFCLAGLLALLLAVQACGLIDYYFLPRPEDTAQELYEAGILTDKDFEGCPKDK